MKVCTEYSDGVFTLRPALRDERGVWISDGLWNAYKRHRENCCVWDLLLYRIDNKILEVEAEPTCIGCGATKDNCGCVQFDSERK